MRQFWKANFGDDEIVAFIDEAGDEAFKDPGNPVFVIGCCLVRGQQVASLRESWTKLRVDFFGDSEKALHMRKATISPRRLEALNKFIQSAECNRVSIALSDKTEIETKPAPSDLIFQTSIALIGQAIAKLMTGSPSSGLTFVIEDSERLRSAYQRHLPSYRFLMDGISLPVSWTFVNKEDNEPALDIADFISHTTAGFIRDGRNEDSKFANRYRAIFGSQDNSISYEVNAMEQITPWTQPLKR
jgi:hypothetical protein